jgi:hypothetical protein
VATGEDLPRIGSQPPADSDRAIGERPTSVAIAKKLGQSSSAKEPLIAA